MRRLVIPAVATLLLVAAMAYQARTVDPVVCEAPAVRLDALDGFAVEDVPVSEAERTVLPKDTDFLKRCYTDPEGRTFCVTAVIGGKEKSSIHRPELCLPAQGFQMRSPRTVEVGGVSWHLVSLGRRDAPDMGFAYTFFNQAGYRTSSHLRRIFRDVWDRSILGRVDRWVMVTVYSSAADERIVTSFLRRLEGVVK